MTSRTEKIHEVLVVADFNAANLATLLTQAAPDVPMRARCAPFGPVMPHLLVQDLELWTATTRTAVVWASPEGVSEAYRRRLATEASSLDEMAAETQQFVQALTRLPRRVEHIFVASFTPFHPMLARRGLLDLDPEVGLSVALMKMNLALYESSRVDPRIRVFDATRWSALVGDKGYDPRLWYGAKTPFSLAVFKHAVCDLVAALRGLEGRARKLVVLDLDDTLWGGILGDEGWEALRVGGHDAVGEAYRDFQAALKSLSRRGILLGIASKNDEAAALTALRSHPEMLLRPDDFAGWKINWDDKAQNLVQLVEQLNLGLDAAVFIDDNPVERDRIRTALPTVLVPDWPASPLYYCSALAALDCFDTPVVSDEDRNRTAMYVAERERRRLREDLDLDGWMYSLKVVVRVAELSEAYLARATQLLNKTNQMNLSTRRLSAQEFRRWAVHPDHCAFVFNVTDRFGDYGLVGIGTLALDPARKTASVVDLVLSCRVMGRQVEESILHFLENAARARGCERLVAEYLPTPKNAPCMNFLQRNLERVDDGNFFALDLRMIRSGPACTTVVEEALARSQPTAADRDGTMEDRRVADLVTRHA
ncbi:MAG: HAD-IIIC family phosphatase [Deltaproteobacteria bacterium]|nr:HAD-IIIC family phosphatase [Deltaproteobacteria bacterium]